MLLDQIGVDHALIDAPIDETRRAGEPPEQFVRRMACEKAIAGLAALGGARQGPVLAADTAVVLDGQVLGKPRDEAHAVAMLRSLSGRMHRVISAVAMTGRSEWGRSEWGRSEWGRSEWGGTERGGTGGNAMDGRGGWMAKVESAGEHPKCTVSVSRVWFRDIPYEEVRAYCATEEPLDKAGAYAIQGRAAVFVTRLDGSFSGVMGLPLFETASLLRSMGVRV